MHNVGKPRGAHNNPLIVSQLMFLFHECSSLDDDGG